MSTVPCRFCTAVRNSFGRLRGSIGISPASPPSQPAKASSVASPGYSVSVPKPRTVPKGAIR